LAPPAAKAGAKAARHAVPILLGLREQLSKGTSRVLDGHRAVCRFAHDDKALYFSAEVKDDLLAPSAKDQSPRKTDRLTLCIDARPADQSGRPGHSNRFYEICFLAPGEDSVPSVRVFQPWGAKADLVTCKSRRIPGGYGVEAVVPWAFLEMPKARRRRLAIQVSLASNSHSGKENVEMHWTGRGEAHKPERFGHLFLLTAGGRGKA